MSNPTKALVVEDSYIARHVITHFLKSYDIPSVQAKDGAKGFEILERDPAISFVIIDWSMPGMSGLQFAKKVRSHAKYDRIKLLMVTARDTDESMAAAQINGIDDFITKPIDKEMFARRLQANGLN